MKTSPRLLATIVGATAAVWAAGCGDNSDRCGTGTTADNGVCVPNGDVHCGQGTILDAQSGECVFDPTACADGTVYVDGKCIPDDDNLKADFDESAEPNDGTASGDGGPAGHFNLPAIGTAGVVIHGCVDPYRDADMNGALNPDYDPWEVVTTGPALVQITADGVHGLDAGFYVQGTQADLVNAGYVRYGINLSGDTSARQVYLPEAGTYDLVMTDSRSLFLTDGAAGGPTDCYYTTVKQLAVPTPTAIVSGTPVADLLGSDDKFYKYTAANGNLIDALHHVGPAGGTISAAVPSLIAMRNGAFAAYSAPDGFFTIDAEVFAGGLQSSDDVELVVDPVYNYALESVDMTLAVTKAATVPLPTDGSTVTVTNVGDAPETLGDILFGTFTVGDNKVVHLHLDSSDALDLGVFDSNLNFVTAIAGYFNDTAPSDTFDGWMKMPAAGTYYLVMFDEEGSTGTTFDLTTSIDEVTPAPLVVGTPVDNAPFNDAGSTWYTLDTTSAIWVATSASATGFGGNLELESYDPASVGQFDVDFAPLQTRAFATDGSDTLGDIVFHGGSQTLVRVTDAAGTADSSSTYDLTVGNRAFTDLGTVTEVTPINQTAITASATGNLFFVRGNAGDSFQIIATPTGFNTSIDQLNRDETSALTVNTGGSGAAEELDGFFTSDGYAAFRVNKLGGAGTTFDLAINASAPTLYTVSAGSLSYADICSDPNAVTLLVGSDDNITDVTSMPFAFAIHGQPASNFYVSSNGFLSFTPPSPIDDSFYLNQPIPTPGTPDGVVAPLWTDLMSETVCELDTATSVTIQWTGETYNPGGLGTGVPSQFQAILNSDDTIDFVYGAGETFTGTTGTVGTESLGGTLGNQIEFNTGGVAASTSKIFTPM